MTRAGWLPYGPCSPCCVCVCCLHTCMRHAKCSDGQADTPKAAGQRGNKQADRHTSKQFVGQMNTHQQQQQQRRRQRRRRLVGARLHLHTPKCVLYVLLKHTLTYSHTNTHSLTHAVVCQRKMLNEHTAK